MGRNKRKPLVVEGKRWIPSIQDWAWIITLLWMGIANVWKPFGLFGFVCMFTPILIAFSGRGKMHCSRVCPRGSLIGQIGRRMNIGLTKPAFMGTHRFRFILWAVMMGSFAVVLVIFIPRGVYSLGNAVLVFMEIATGIAIASGILFTPRAWCTYCPMGFTTERIRGLTRKKRAANER